MDTSILQQIQTELKCPKSSYNDFGKYHYRSSESIQEALKPILAKYGYSLTLNDAIVPVSDRVYIEATVTLLDESYKVVITTRAYAREPLTQKGMNDAQITGSCSSYARKYALGGMFLLDDTKDADSMEPPNNKKPEPAAKIPAKTPEKDDKAKDPTKWITGWLTEAKRFKEALGHQAYYELLNKAGSKHANEIKSKALATTVFNAMTTALDDLKEPGNDKEPEKDGNPKEPSIWMTDWLKEAKKLRGLLSDGPYYEILDKHGIPHADNIKDETKAEAIFVELTKALDDK